MFVNESRTHGYFWVKSGKLRKMISKKNLFSLSDALNITMPFLAAEGGFPRDGTGSFTSSGTGSTL